MSYSCPDCASKWKITLILRHTKWHPIICPSCERKFHFDKKQWKQISFPLMVATCVVFVAQIVNIIVNNQLSFWVFIILGIGFLAIFIWWIRKILKDLKFEIKT